jgi:5-methylcytosine-specific restriction protein A
VRSTLEWIGKTDDAKVPDYVRLRIFTRANGICHISKRKITPADDWDLDHILALCNGGEHRESNMAPALVKPHKVKTAEDVKQRAKNDRVLKKHLGIKKPRTIRSWRKFNGEIVHAGRDR